CSPPSRSGQKAPSERVATMNLHAARQQETHNRCVALQPPLDSPATQDPSIPTQVLVAPRLTSLQRALQRSHHWPQKTSPAGGRSAGRLGCVGRATAG